jgi:hypothetical protein
VSRRCSQSSSPTPFLARANSIFSLVLFPRFFRRPFVFVLCFPSLLLFAPVLPVCRFPLYAFTNTFLPAPWVADLHVHLGLAIRDGVAMRSCIRPVSWSIIQPCRPPRSGSRDTSSALFVATELVSALESFRVAAANPRPRRGRRAGFSPHFSHNHLPLPPPLQSTLLQPIVAPLA